MTAVELVLRQAIARQRVIPFARFMEVALYCPDCGYYEQRPSVIGRAGDFYTNVSVGPVYGQLLAYQFANWLEALPGPEVHLLEAGAHDGSLAGDIMVWLATERPGVLHRLQYWILEPSVRRQTWQRTQLEKTTGKARWFGNWTDLPPTGVNGIIFSNELLDGLPVHRLGWDAAATRWFEWGVTLREDRFAWERMPSDATQAEKWFAEAGLEMDCRLKRILPDGFTVDLCPAAATWWKSAAAALHQGKLLTIDYGLTAEQILIPERQQGTLRAFRYHHAPSDLLAHPGEQDLTAHANFTQLQRAGEAVGLRTEGLLSQEQFLTEIAWRALEAPASFGEWTPARLRQLRTLTHPEHLGRPFSVLIQSRPS